MGYFSRRRLHHPRRLLPRKGVRPGELAGDLLIRGGVLCPSPPQDSQPSTPGLREPMEPCLPQPLLPPPLSPTEAAASGAPEEFTILLVLLLIPSPLSFIFSMLLLRPVTPPKPSTSRNPKQASSSPSSFPSPHGAGAAGGVAALDAVFSTPFV